MPPCWVPASWGGIAYQSASKGIPAVMKDINEKALALGMNEATKLLNGQLEKRPHRRHQDGPGALRHHADPQLPTQACGRGGRSRGRETQK